ncbi:MAG: glycine cleavage system protein GcvH [Ferroplasma sp.]|uniref:glycine cleavage system protein GcvH n=1 Tax=Ferroplasma sp. TaxID=2591003 RepID=UPI0028169561|nr:glycine cleavage system protein GcvH [Ferroplasma sp.]WMT51417.1 MAG: glycine cleavage system protein GcvH [Ferroplasma sp.]
MSTIPADLRYTKSHEWFKIENGIATVGITDFAQHQLTDIVYIDMPGKGAKGKAGDTLLTIESVKSAEDVYFPVTGEVIETNQDLNEKPELVNSDSYKYWLVKIKMSDEKYESMSPEEYKAYIGE